MPLSNEDKLDLLWKHFRNVAPTSSDKASHNEAITSIDPTFQKNFWTDSDRIPDVAPNVVVPDGNELWYEIVKPYKQLQAVQLVVDPTTQNTAWHAMNVFLSGVVEGNRLKNWVPPSFHPSYNITVWAGDPEVQTMGTTRLTATAQGYEWIFDYATGTLFFPNDVPPIAVANGIWIEGWRYIGEIGREGQAGPANTSKIREYTREIALDGNESKNFDLPTGGKCILVEAKVNFESTLECHAVVSRTDTNPYKFKAVSTHLVDDGSYSVMGNRYYGERFVPLINMEDTTSDLTYWKITNDSAEPRLITVIVKVT